MNGQKSYKFCKSIALYGGVGCGCSVGSVSASLASGSDIDSRAGESFAPLPLFRESHFVIYWQKEWALNTCEQPRVREME